MSPQIRGASASTVDSALETGDPLPGTRGFAGELDRGVVRDVLGRQPVYTERDDPTTWSFDPRTLAEPTVVPAGTVRTENGTRQVWTLPEFDASTDEETAVSGVRTAVCESIDAVGTDGLAVAFSGGVDSTAIAARLDAPLYVAGFEDSHDVEAAHSAAETLGRDLQVVALGHDDVERAVRGVVEATGRTNAMDVQIAVPLFLVAERVATDGYDRLALGQGADELFGGYAKVARAPEDPRVEADTVRGARREVVETLPDQLERDVLTLRGAGVEPVAPLLDDRVVRAALDLPETLLVGDDGERKVVFRRAVREWLPDSIAARDKKALQYGSLAARELDRMARQAGYKRRLDDHVTKYVESLTRS